MVQCARSCGRPLLATRISRVLDSGAPCWGVPERAPPRTVVGHPRGQLLADILERCETINRNPRSSHEIDSVTLYGSLCDPLASEIGDVDVAVVARRRDRIDLANPSPRIQLERMLRANNERADVVVTDESWSEGTVIPDGALRRVVYPKPVDEQSD